MKANHTRLFLVWRVFQRRSESLATAFGARIVYLHYPWEERSRWRKAISYLLKSIATVCMLLTERPSVVLVQLPPAPLLYVAFVVARLTGSRLVADCHNAMLVSHWHAWPFVGAILRRATCVLVHNEDVLPEARRLGLNATVLRDPLPEIDSSGQAELRRFNFLTDMDRFVIVPWSFAADEPIAELFDAARQCPDIVMVMTWFAERLPQELRGKVPDNIRFSGFLPVEAFNALFAAASAAVVLTSREGTQPSAASEALVLNVPLVISDLETTRRLYRDAAVYVANTAEGIVRGVRSALDDAESLKATMRRFLVQYRGELEAEIEAVRESLSDAGRH